MTTPLQKHIIETLGAKATINPAEEIRMRVNFLKTFLKTSGAKGFVLGISGGQDSSLAGRLCQLAVEEIRAEGGEASFTAMRLPYGVQHDEVDAQTALQFIKPDNSVVFNIKGPVDATVAEYDNMGLQMTDYVKGNVKARQRMIAQYAVAGQNGLLVISSDNGPEAAIGYFTKAGDGAADIAPISGLTKGQEKAMLQELGAVKSIYTKVPTADLLDGVVGQPDEVELGITYDQLDNYLEGEKVDIDTVLNIEERYLKTEHKRRTPVTPFDTWWK